MSWPQKTKVKHSHEFTLQFGDDHFVYSRDQFSQINRDDSPIRWRNEGNHQWTIPAVEVI